MRKLLFTLVLSVFCANLNASVPAYGVKKTSFGWNKAIEAGFGYSHMYGYFSSDSYGHMNPKELMQVDLNCFGIYFGIGYWAKNTGYKVYGYDERVSTFTFKFGPSVRYRFAYNKAKLVFAPYVGWGVCTVDDSSNNAIGQRQDYGNKSKCFIGGMKLSAVYKWAEIGINASNKECGVTLGVNIDFD